MKVATVVIVLTAMLVAGKAEKHYEPAIKRSTLNKCLHIYECTGHLCTLRCLIYISISATIATLALASVLLRPYMGESVH